MGTKYSNKEKSLLIELGNRIRNLRVEAALSQEKLAFESELDRTYIGSVERGERNISIINLNKIATALKTDLSNICKV
ncbi:MAG: helix-turn-helix transcriptional regulator [Chitinophagaceae bacterium]